MEDGLSDHFWSIGRSSTYGTDRGDDGHGSERIQWPRRTLLKLIGACKLRHLHELIAALDRRVPRVERAGEVAIARDAAALRKKALQRIAKLEGQSGDHPN
jgi:hypothetical protein